MLSAEDRKALGIPSSDDDDLESGFFGMNVGSWVPMGASDGESGSHSMVEFSHYITFSWLTTVTRL